MSASINRKYRVSSPLYLSSSDTSLPHPFRIPGRYNDHVCWKMLPIGDLHNIAYCYLFSQGQEYSSMEKKKQTVRLSGMLVCYFLSPSQKNSIMHRTARDSASESQSTFHCKFGSIKAFPFLNAK